jgi:hypothetical protein
MGVILSFLGIPVGRRAGTRCYHLSSYPAEECYRRLQIRGRAEEKNISLDYLRQLEVAHDEWLLAPAQQPVVLLDGMQPWTANEIQQKLTQTLSHGCRKRVDMAYILIVDDDWMSREVLRLMCSLAVIGGGGLRWNSGAFHDPDRPPDLVLLDVRMHGWTGMRFAVISK